MRQRIDCLLIASGKGGVGTSLMAALTALTRVPSPTYTLLEQYAIGELVVVHLDLYRLASEVELENLGLRDWLETPATCSLYWPPPVE